MDRVRFIFLYFYQQLNLKKSSEYFLVIKKTRKKEKAMLCNILTGPPSISLFFLFLSQSSGALRFRQFNLMWFVVSVFSVPLFAAQI